MKRRIHGVIFLLVLGCFFQDVSAQRISVSSSIDRNNILIGEPIRLRMEAFVPTGTGVAWFALDSIPHFEFIEKGKIDSAIKENGTQYRQLLTITSFDSGHWVVPSMSLDINGRYYLTDSLPVSVAFSKVDPNQDYHDIHDILEIKYADGRTITLVIAGIALLSLLALVYFLRKRRQQVEKPVAKPETTLAPFEQAMLSLEQLRNQQLPERGQLKLYYTGLNDILRSFVSAKMSTVTMQKTNDELILQLREPGLQNEHYIRLAQTLRMADAVKFAKFLPGREDNDQSFEIIKTTIQQLNNLTK